MNWVTILGFVAASLTTIAYIPQAYKTIKTKRTRDISLIMYLILNIGVIGWLIYGIILLEWPIILANAITFLFTVPILYLKLKFR